MYIGGIDSLQYSWWVEALNHKVLAFEQTIHVPRVPRVCHGVASGSWGPKFQNSLAPFPVFPKKWTQTNPVIPHLVGKMLTFLLFDGGSISNPAEADVCWTISKDIYSRISKEI